MAVEEIPEMKATGKKIILALWPHNGNLLSREQQDGITLSNLH
jgi:hypothetical protein